MSIAPLHHTQPSGLDQTNGRKPQP